MVFRYSVKFVMAIPQGLFRIIVIANSTQLNTTTKTLICYITCLL